jgi:hypothetical protein
MAPLAKTIQIFLPDGDARSIRIADITSRTVRAVQIPRAKLRDAEPRPEINCVGVYYLFGEPENGTSQRVYIGEAEDLCSRLRQHAVGKDFWSTLIAVSSKTQGFTKAHAKYLEWLSYEQAEKAARFQMLNSAKPSKPFVSEAMEADLHDNFDTIRVLLSTLGYPLFEEIGSRQASTRVFACSAKGIVAKGALLVDGFVVFKDSAARLDETRERGDSWVSNTRKSLVAEGVLKQNGDKYVFTRDHLFGSPSTAAMTVLGRRANGWTSWKDDSGKTLDELERQ